MASILQKTASAEPTPAVTRERILDAAEALFAKRGLEAVSVRDITAAASANVGAVNYYFGSKQELVLEVFQRRLGPLNERRFKALDELEREAGRKSIPLKVLIETMIRPPIELAFDAKSGAVGFTRIMGRVLAEEGETLETLRQEHFVPLLKRFEPALARALPGLSREELYWRIILIFGGLHHMLLSLHSPPKEMSISRSTAEVQVQRMVTFATAGLRAAANS